MHSSDVGRQHYVRFPPRWRHVLVPFGPRGAAALGTTLYTASRPRPLAAQRVLWALAGLGGGRLLPGPRELWQPPVPLPVWQRLWSDWEPLVGRIDGLAVHSRPQASRRGLVLALWSRRRSVVVRLRTAVLDSDAAVAAAPAARTFAVPATVGRGAAGGWHWLASQPMSHRPHGPVTALPAGLLAEVATTVAGALARPAGTPTHWQPAHGDLTPWNLRRVGGRTWLIDWEDAGWAPPGADEVYFAATAAVLRNGRGVVVRRGGPYEEAVRFWLQRLARRAPTDVDAALTGRLAAVLGGPEAG